MMKMNLLFAFLILMTSCSDDDDNNNPEISVDPPTATGIVYFESAFNMQTSYANLKSALEDNEDISIVQELDHSQNAASVDMDLAPTQIIFFGNPNLGTPLMQENQLAGLDLPQKVLFYEEQGQVFALYNSTEYLASRYGVSDIITLPSIAEALENLVETAVDAPAVETTNQLVDAHAGIESVESTTDFDSTYSNLKSAIEANENLSIVAELDHQANAASVGMELRPTKVIMFGNPNLGTPLMQSVNSIGLDLPQKMLVWEDEAGAVHISYNSPEFLKGKHQLQANDQEIDQIGTALETLANTAAEVE
ncbi:DUF302 domain-containing protein [Salegentibacter sp.]|uniref:DUF302 domain-containing protein n=1 Tax=Salegentibacter sp. TaxID=1903072 RepID=UPI0035685D49